MAISTDNAIEFFGTQTTVITTTGTIADAAFSSTTDATTGAFTNSDDAIRASVTLTCTYATAPTANSAVQLYARLMNTDGTSDQPVPDANFQHYYLGSFPLNDVTTSQSITIDVSLPNAYTSQSYEFFIENSGGQTMSSGATVKLTPKAIGPKA